MAKASRVYGHVVGADGSTVGRLRDLKGSAGVAHIGIAIDTAEIGRLADLMQNAGKVAPAAVARALNRTANETRTAMSRALVQQTGLPYGAVRSAITTLPASAGSLTAAIIAKGSYVPLKLFKARQTGKGVSAAPWNKRRVFPHTFLIRRYAGNVYRRVSKKRFPLHKLYGPAIPVEFTKDQSELAFQATAPVVLLKRLEHELGRLLG